MKTRSEKDLIGSLEIPDGALFGIHTLRAVRNFSITGLPISHFPDFIVALAMVKKSAALANFDVGALSFQQLRAITAACDEIIGGEHHSSFVVDLIQGGAGTSTNMNANEVIANVGLRSMGLPAGSYSDLHPNDVVNKSQSTNDVYPTAIRLATLRLTEKLTSAMSRLRDAFGDRADAFVDIAKVGRTQLQDAVPMSLGLEFRAFASGLNKDLQHLRETRQLLLDVNLGGTAIGTGINVPLGFAEKAVGHLNLVSGYEFRLADDLLEASYDVSALVSQSSALKRIAVRLSKISNDLRLLSSGPRAGIGEIILPAVQAGSSIMPGKVNPVIPEAVTQVAYQVAGNDLAITMAAEAGELQLNAMEPVIAYNLFTSIDFISHAMETLAVNCVLGIRANEVRCHQLLSNSLARATELVPLLGYENAAAIAKTARTLDMTLNQAAERLGFTIEQPQAIDGQRSA